MGRRALEYPLVGTNEGDPLGFYLGLFTVSDQVVHCTESGEATPKCSGVASQLS